MSILAWIAASVIALAALVTAYYEGAKAGMRSMQPTQDYLLRQIRRLQAMADKVRDEVQEERDRADHLEDALHAEEDA